ncbi:energy transducer TonB [Ponticaulis koreensis]|uniref:energy transducer TonB n=1 Tax=Ponticaulis koreensis TaxID=1123045 RepID=UPI0003B349B6|nr:energy transducer TonB [Ponticaulis koreensis]
MWKTLSAAVLPLVFGAFCTANAEADLCNEIEWWIIEGLTETPFVSLDPAFRSEDNGGYRPGASLEPLNGEPCGLNRELPNHAEGTMKVTSLTCRFPVNGEARGRLRDARDGYYRLKEQLAECSVLQDWQVREDEGYSRYATNWSHPGSEQLSLILRSESLYTSNSSDLDITLERVEFESETAPPRTGTTRPPAMQTVRPRNLNRWASRVSQAYPEIARRLGWEGTVGLTVIVDESGQPQDCEITRTSGWPILDHTACESMIGYAQFHTAVDDQGNTQPGQYSTQILYQLD